MYYYIKCKYKILRSFANFCLYILMEVSRRWCGTGAQFTWNISAEFGLVRKLHCRRRSRELKDENYQGHEVWLFIYTYWWLLTGFSSCSDAGLILRDWKYWFNPLSCSERVLTGRCQPPVCSHFRRAGGGVVPHLWGALMTATGSSISVHCPSIHLQRFLPPNPHSQACLSSNICDDVLTTS